LLPPPRGRRAESFDEARAIDFLELFHAFLRSEETSAAAAAGAGRSGKDAGGGSAKDKRSRQARARVPANPGGDSLRAAAAHAEKVGADNHAAARLYLQLLARTCSRVRARQDSDRSEQVLPRAHVCICCDSRALCSLSLPPSLARFLSLCRCLSLFPYSSLCCGLWRPGAAVCGAVCVCVCVCVCVRVCSRTHRTEGVGEREAEHALKGSQGVSVSVSVPIPAPLCVCCPQVPHSARVAQVLRSLVAACPSISNGATRARILAILADFLPLHPGEDGGASNELMHLLQAHLELDGSAQGFGAGRRRRELLLASKAGRFGVASPVYGTGNGSTAGAGSGGGQAGWVGGWGGPDSEFFAHCLLRCAIRCPALAAAVEEVLAQVSARAVRSLQLSASGEQAEEGWKEEGRYAAGADSSGGSGDSGWGGGKMGGERRLVPPMLLRLEAVRALLVQHYPHLAQPGACAAPPAAPHTSAPALAAGMDAQKGACAAVGGWPLVCTAPPSEEVAAPAPCYRILDVVTGNDTALHGNPFDPPSSPGLGAGRAMAGGVAGVEGGVGSGREDGDALEALVPEAVWRVWGAEYGGGDAGGGGVGGSGLSVGWGWGVSGVCRWGMGKAQMVRIGCCTM